MDIQANHIQESVFTNKMVEEGLNIQSCQILKQVW